MNKNQFFKYYLNHKKIVIKILILFLLLIIYMSMFLLTNKIINKNTKMLKYINSGVKIEQNYSNLKSTEKLFSKYILKINNKILLEKTKADYINLILNEIKNNNLENISYQSDLSEKDGFIILKYNVTVIGDFINLINFFSTLKKKNKSIYIKKYDIKLNGDKWIRASIVIEVLGEKNY